MVFQSEQTSQNGGLWSSIESLMGPLSLCFTSVLCWFSVFSSCFFFYKSFIKTDKFILCGLSTLISKKSPVASSKNTVRSLKPRIPFIISSAAPDRWRPAEEQGVIIVSEGKKKEKKKAPLASYSLLFFVSRLFCLSLIFTETSYLWLHGSEEEDRAWVPVGSSLRLGSSHAEALAAGGSHLTSTAGENDNSHVSDATVDIWERFSFGRVIWFFFLQVVFNLCMQFKPGGKTHTKPQTVPKKIKNHHFKKWNEKLFGPCPHVCWYFKTDFSFPFWPPIFHPTMSQPLVSGHFKRMPTERWRCNRWCPIRSQEKSQYGAAPENSVVLEC